MDKFKFSRPTTLNQAVQLGACVIDRRQKSAEVRFVAGGTT